MGFQYTPNTSEYCRFCNEKILFSQGFWKSVVKLKYLVSGRWIGDPAWCLENAEHYHLPR